MNIIFIHGNYPGQFKHLVANLEGIEGIKTHFITERKEVKPTNSINLINMKPHREPSENTHHYLKTTEECVLRGQAVIRELDGLEKEGISLDIIICHGGMGYGLFIKDLRPETIVISYNEWFFTANNSKSLFASFEFDHKLVTRTRNFTTISELESCDLAICPTEWQKKQFPSEYWNKLKVIYDGIDHSFFHEKYLGENDLTIRNRETGEEFQMKKEDIILSYATRGMEPLRCFSEFMRAIPYILRGNKNIKVIIAGADRVAYSYGAPNNGGSWKNFELEKMSDEIKSRIYFTGLLDWKDYRTLLQRSNLHCYFSRPYVLSWSFIEAATCGCNIATNNMEGMKEVVDNDSVHWVDIDNEKKLAVELIEAISNRKKAELKITLTLKNYLQNWQDTINDVISRRK